MKTSIAPRLTLVGAGPGAADLITLRGIRALQSADAVLYDALVDKELLDYAPTHAPKIFVGKKYGEVATAQDHINALIVEYTQQYGHVVRLKGGDPFVFGRGQEEIEYAQVHGITTEVVPGLSSALAVPALQDIPLTVRGISESFWVLTGTTRHRGLSGDLALAAKSSATLVILMGMHRLADIAEVLAYYGKGDTPVAIIQNGSTPQEKIGIGTVSNITEVAARQQLGSPAIIVVGEVVRYHLTEVKQALAALAADA